jgi:uncharacterized RDD family membrane protein YckC
MSTDQPAPGPEDARSEKSEGSAPEESEGSVPERPEDARSEESKDSPPAEPEGGASEEPEGGASEEPESGEQPLPPPPPPPPGPEGGAPKDAVPPSPWAEEAEREGEDPLAGMPPLAARWRRLVARIIDALIIGIPATLVLELVWGSYDVNNTGRSVAQDLVYALIYFVYEALMLTTYGQTVGKMLMRIRVGMLDNGEIPTGAPGWTRAAVYTLPPIVFCCGSVFWLFNVAWLLWDKPYRQALHDKAANTVVVSTTDQVPDQDPDLETDLETDLDPDLSQEAEQEAEDEEGRADPERSGA